MTSTQVSTQYTTGHIGLNVSNLARSKRLSDVFGFDLAGESELHLHRTTWLS
jgi:hypothetical protein